MSDKTIRITNPTGATHAHHNRAWRLNVPADLTSDHEVPAGLVDDIVLTFAQNHPRLTIEVLDDATPTDDEQQAE